MTFTYSKKQKKEITEEALKMLREFSESNLKEDGPSPEACLIFSAAALNIVIEFFWLVHKDKGEDAKRAIELLVNVGKSLGEDLVEQVETDKWAN